jgi:DNA-binding SARP family transcriptional activator/predicted ATPase
VEFRVLGPLEVRADGAPVQLGGVKQRTLLALLVLNAGRVVSRDQIVDALWGERPPESAVKGIQVYVWQLRKLLPKGTLVTRPTGYSLVVEPDDVDVLRFERLVAEARDAAPDAAERLLREALGLWRGPALAQFGYEEFARSESARLTDLRLAALEQRLEADLALGRHVEVVPELEALVREHPLRESLRGLLMLALYRSGRQADALANYHDARATLVEELGLDPGQALQRLEQAILRQDPALDLAPPPPAGEPTPAPVPADVATRKTVTVLSAGVDVEASDPELVESARSGFVEPAAALLKRHGATVDTGGAETLTAVFGVPAVHEDDALRAVRAATELRAAHPTCRISVVTGEVLTATGDRIAIGEPMTMAARLGRRAGLGEVLLGTETLPFVRGAVDVEADGPDAYRLLALKGLPERRWQSPMVGRAAELRQLEEAFAALVSGRCRLFTILGDAGIGKSRLAAEFLAGLDAAVARGRCLPYGEGITYFPVVEVLEQLGTRPAEPAAAAAIASVLGETDAPVAADEIAWAVRKTLEEAAAGRPLAVVLDDIQWGEEAFLDLIEHVADFARDSPILLLCMARPELIERRPGWAGGKPNVTTTLLDPLSVEEADELIALLAPADETLRTRVRRAAGGNPLFIEAMLAFARESGGGEVVVPPTIRALLAARLDQLDAAERAVLQRGAVEGEIFHRGAVEALAPTALDADQLLMSLVSKELVRSHRAQLAGEEAFRFRHLLLRDAAYDTLPKAARSELHERLARWLEDRGAALPELDELVAYHLEQAHRYGAELGHSDDVLAAAARSRLTAAGSEALLREDPAAALNLLARARALLPEGAVDVLLDLEFNQALIQGGDTAGAARQAHSNAERATDARDLIAELCARIDEGLCVSRLEPEGAHERVFDLIAEALPVFEAAQDQLALWFGNWALGFMALDLLQTERARAALEQSLVHARRAGLARQELMSLRFLTNALRKGPTSIETVVDWVRELEARGLRQSWLPSVRAEALAMAGRFDEARAILETLQAELTERGARNAYLTTLSTSLDVELLAADYGAATALAREGCRYLEQRGLRIVLGIAKAQLAQALYGLGATDEADAEAANAAELAASGAVVTQTMWRQIRAKVLAHRGKAADAELLAREAVALAEETDMPVFQGDAWADLAEVLDLAGKHVEAADALAQAIALYERKGSMASIDRVRAQVTVRA